MVSFVVHICLFLHLEKGCKNNLILPGTYGTSLIRNHTMQGALAEMQNQGIPTEVIEN